MPHSINHGTVVKKLPGSETGSVRGRLQRIQDWELLAGRAFYNCHILARMLGVSLRQLQRQTRARYGTTLCEWLDALRIQHGHQRLAAGCTVTETAFSLGYKQVSHFSRAFKDHFGFPPSSVPITLGTPPTPPAVAANSSRSAATSRAPKASA